MYTPHTSVLYVSNCRCTIWRYVHKSTHSNEFDLFFLYTSTPFPIYRMVVEYFPLYLYMPNDKNCLDIYIKKEIRVKGKRFVYVNISQCRHNLYWYLYTPTTQYNMKLSELETWKRTDRTLCVLNQRKIQYLSWF